MTDSNQPDQQPSDSPRPPAPASHPASGHPAPPSYAGAETPTDAARPALNPPAYESPSSVASAPAYSTGGGTVPGKTLGVVAFILSFFLQLVALVLGIVALVQSKKAGAKNGFALAAIIISSVLLVLAVIALVLVFALVLGPIMEACATYGPGEYVLENGMPLTCG